MDFPETKHVEDRPSTAPDRESQIVVADLDGTILRSPNCFPYFLLVALEGGSLLRAILLLLVYPVAWLLSHLVSESAGIRLLLFLSCAGLKIRDVESVGRAVLPKFYAEDVNQESWQVFSSFGKKFIVTECPRVMVESFAQNQLGVEKVLGTELQVTATGRCTGFPKIPGVLIGKFKRKAVETEFRSTVPDLGMGDSRSDQEFMSICKETMHIAKLPRTECVLIRSLLKPVIFHDGRLVRRPTPLMALLYFAWMPLAFTLSICRVVVCLSLPYKYLHLAGPFLWMRLDVKGTLPPGPSPTNPTSSGVLFVCCHRTLLDPIYIAAALRRPVAAVTYSLSTVSELLAPIKTVRLTRNPLQDAAKIKQLLKVGDVVLCPEGTTCREAVLLRFSALFAELTDKIVPVAVTAKGGIFHGTCARGWKAMDGFFFLMNPYPVYELVFLDQLPPEMTCGGGRSRYEVANYVQKLIAGTLAFECSSFTRRDKYRLLTGNDGNVVEQFINRNLFFRLPSVPSSPNSPFPSK